MAHIRVFLNAICVRNFYKKQFPFSRQLLWSDFSKYQKPCAHVMIYLFLTYNRPLIFSTRVTLRVNTLDNVHVHCDRDIDLCL
jgi:hypothetical protein